jgi:hypothetical protein
VTWSEPVGRAIVYERSMGRCECCGRGASEWHHRANRSQGGTWSPANGLHLCRWCHQWVTEHPRDALLLGLGSLPHHLDPATVPAYLHPTMWWRGWWLPDTAGCWAFADDPPTDRPDATDRSRAVETLHAARDIAMSR